MPDHRCPVCGAVAAPSAHFCTSCGSALAAGSGPDLGAAGRTPEPDRPAGVRRRSVRRRWWLVGSGALLLVALGVTGGFVYQALRPGAATPEAAVAGLTKAVNDHDLVGIGKLVAPRERAALLRVASAWDERYRQLAIGSAYEADGSKGVSSYPSPDEVHVTVRGAEPTVSRLSDDHALATFTSGEVDLRLGKGFANPLTNLLTTSARPVSGTYLLADLGPDGSGLTLVETKVDGRWYVSLVLSGLDNANRWASGDRGTITPPTPGAVSAARGAEASIRGAAQLTGGTTGAFAASLVPDEAAAVSLYGATALRTLDPDLGAFRIGDVTFSDGRSQDGRREAVLDHLSYRDPRADATAVFTRECVSYAGAEKACLNGTAFGSTTSTGTVWPVVGRGGFGLTTVDTGDGWKVSLLDTVADHLVDSIAVLTRPQALAFLGLDDQLAPSGTLRVGSETTAHFDGSDWVTMRLHVDHGQQVQLGGPQGTSATFWQGGSIVASAFVADDSGWSTDAPELPAGDYTVATTGGDAVVTAWQQQGLALDLTTRVGLREHRPQAMIDGQTGVVTTTLDLAGQWSRDLEVVREDGAGSTLVVTAADDIGGTELAVDLDGELRFLHAGDSTTYTLAEGVQATTVHVSAYQSAEAEVDPDGGLTGAEARPSFTMQVR